MSRRTLGLGLTASTGMAALGSPKAHAAATPSVADGEPLFQLGTRPFRADSPWNTPVPTNSLFTPIPWFTNPAGQNFWINWDKFSPPVYVAKLTDPVWTITTGKDDWFIPAGTQIKVRMPANVRGANGTDREMVAIDGRRVCNFWQFDVVDPAKYIARTTSFAEDDVYTGTGWGSFERQHAAGTTGCGSNLLAGLFVEAEVQRGEIEHALQMAVDVNYNIPSPTMGTALRPALRADGNGKYHLTREGERYAIPASTTLPALTSDIGRKVARAMQRYGVFNVDSGGDGASIMRFQANAWTRATIVDLERDLKTLVPLLHQVC